MRINLQQARQINGVFEVNDVYEIEIQFIIEVQFETVVRRKDMEPTYYRVSIAGPINQLEYGTKNISKSGV